MNMKSIEGLKIDITFKFMEETLVWTYIKSLPKDDEIRTFLCGFNDPWVAYHYAQCVDKTPHNETRKVCVNNPYISYTYADQLDKCPRDDTREGACKYYALTDSCDYACFYSLYVDKEPHRLTRKAAYLHPRTKTWYVKEFGDHEE